MHCAISPTRNKSPFNLLVYKPPTSARNILKIVELGFSQFCLLCALVRLWVELICIRRTKIFQPMMARTPETYPSSTSQDNFLRFGNHQQRKDIPMAEFILETSYPSETNHRLRRITRLNINSVLRRIMEQNSSQADPSVTTSSRRANRRIARLRRIIRL